MVYGIKIVLQLRVPTTSVCLHFIAMSLLDTKAVAGREPRGNPVSKRIDVPWWHKLRPWLSRSDD